MTRGGLGDVATVCILGRHLFGGEEKRAEEEMVAQRIRLCWMGRYEEDSGPVLRWSLPM